MKLIEPGRDYIPYCIQLEPVEGCNRRCAFCGIQGIPEWKRRPERCIELPVLKKAFEDLNEWLPKIRVEINLHGEPMMHLNWMGVLQTIKMAMPTACVSVQTNGEKLFNYMTAYPTIDVISRMFDSGLHILGINAYKGYDEWVELFKERQIEYTDYYYNNPKKLTVNKYYNPKTTRFILLYDDLGSVHRKREVAKQRKMNKRLHNSGGAGNMQAIAKISGQTTKELPLKSACSKVHRELILNWDGTIGICCLDWNDEKIIGDVRTTHIRDIWFGKRFEAIRELLRRKERRLLTPCMGCDDPTTRIGLIKYSNHLEHLSNQNLLKVIQQTEEWDHKNTYQR